MMTTLPIRQRPIVCLDCETTGLSTEKGARIVEVALVKQFPDGHIEEWSTLVNPEIEMHPSNVKIHGISNTMVAKAPLFSDVWPQLEQFLDDSILIAHNASFDVGFLHAEAERLGVTLPELDIIDTLEISRRLFGFPRNNLSIVAHRFNLLVHNAHRALPDARNTFHVFWAMLDDIEDREGKALTSDELRDLCKTHEKQGAFRLAVIQAVVQSYRNKQRLSIDYISRHPEKPIRSERIIEVTKWDSPYVEANCLLRGEPRRFHIKQIQRAELKDEFFSGVDVSEISNQVQEPTAPKCSDYSEESPDTIS